MTSYIEIRTQNNLYHVPMDSSDTASKETEAMIQKTGLSENDLRLLNTCLANSRIQKIYCERNESFPLEITTSENKSKVMKLKALPASTNELSQTTQKAALVLVQKTETTNNYSSNTAPISEDPIMKAMMSADTIKKLEIQKAGENEVVYEILQKTYPNVEF